MAYDPNGSGDVWKHLTYDPYGGGGLWIGLAIAVVVILLRNRRPRALRVEYLWIRPVIFLAISTMVLFTAPPPATALAIGLLVAGVALGAALGWQRGRLIRVEVHPDTHDLTTRVSPASLLFLVALVGLRSVMRGASSEASRIHLPVVAAADAVMLLFGSMMIAQSIEIWLRARRLLAEARARHATIVSGVDGV